MHLHRARYHYAPSNPPTPSLKMSNDSSALLVGRTPIGVVDRPVALESCGEATRRPPNRTPARPPDRKTWGLRPHTCCCEPSGTGTCRKHPLNGRGSAVEPPATVVDATFYFSRGGADPEQDAGKEFEIMGRRVRVPVTWAQYP